MKKDELTTRTIPERETKNPEITRLIERTRNLKKAMDELENAKAELSDSLYLFMRIIGSRPFRAVTQTTSDIVAKLQGTRSVSANLLYNISVMLLNADADVLEWTKGEDKKTKSK